MIDKLRSRLFRFRVKHVQHAMEKCPDAFILIERQTGEIMWNPELKILDRIRINRNEKFRHTDATFFLSLLP